MSDHICSYCNNTFSNKYILKRHVSERCIVKQDPGKLLEIIEQKDKLLAQQKAIIEQLKETKINVINKIDNVDIKNVEKSTNSSKTDLHKSHNSEDIIESKKSESLEIIKNNQYVYIIKEREFIKTNENIYKIGRTDKGFSKRVKSYPNGSVVMCIIKVPDSKKYETAVKKSFNILFKKRKDIGHEYYEANYQDMHNNFCKIIQDLNNDYNKSRKQKK